MKNAKDERLQMEKEKYYLQHYILDNPAFCGNVKTIAKMSSPYSKSREGLVVEFKRTDPATMLKTLSFRSFKKGELYRWMEPNKRYTIKELDLIEFNTSDTRYVTLYADEFESDVWAEYCKAAGVSLDATEITIGFDGGDVTYQVDGNSSND